MRTEIMALRSWWTRVSAGAAAYAVVGLFVIENHCGIAPVDHRQLAVHLLERGHFDRALVEARRAAREADSQVDGHVISALAYLGLERPNEAVSSIVDAIRIEPNDARLFATLREIGLQSDRAELVLYALEDLEPELPAPNWHLRVTLAWTHMRLEANDEALPLLEEAVDTGNSVDLKNRLFAHLQLSRLYITGERFAEAGATLTNALALDPQDRRLNLALGEALLSQGELERADDQFLKVVSPDDEPLETILHIARLYYDHEQIRSAIRYYELALSRDSNKPLILNNLAWAYAQERIDLERASQLSLRAVKSDADNVVYLDTYAELLYVRGCFDRAVAVMEQALQLEPETSEYYEYLQEQLVKFQTATDSARGRQSANRM